MRPRPLARRLAFQYIFIRDLNKNDCEAPAEFLFTHTDRDEVRDFAEELVTAVIKHEAEIDETLSRNLANYSLQRVAGVERNVLRLAVAEMLAGTAPNKVVIDEAVELAKAFGGKGSGGFVNGILDAVLRDTAITRPQDAEPTATGEAS